MMGGSIENRSLLGKTHLQTPVLDAQPPSLKTATLIFNPVAGRRPARRRRQIVAAQAALEASGLAVTVVQTLGPGGGQAAAREAVERGERFVLVCGGDGTINEVLNGLIPGQAALGILPGGTANIIARELGLPLDPVCAARRIPFWSARSVAVGRVTWPAGGMAAHSYPVQQRYFLSVAGVGFDAHVVYKLSSAFKNALGVVAYGIEAVRQAIKYTFPTFSCRFDRREIIGGFAVVHRTSRYAGWLHLAPGARFFDSKLRLSVFKSRDWKRYFLYAGAVILRQHLRLSDVEMVETEKILCLADQYETPIRFELDGELGGELPATFEAIPDALSLLVP